MNKFARAVIRDSLLCKLALLLFVTTLTVPYSQAHAQSTSIQALQARVLELLEIVADLQQQLLVKQSGEGQFTRNLSLHDTGEDVRRLQVILNQNPSTRVASSGPGSPGSETTYFGPATARAVIKYQELNRGEVLLPENLSRGTGFVGSRTIALLNRTHRSSGSSGTSIATSNTSSSGSNQTTVSTNFGRSLSLGDKGEDVRNLQKLLNGDTRTRIEGTAEGSPGKETNFFGPATQRAVIKFQELHRTEVLLPVGLSRGSGFVGSATISKLQEVARSRGGGSTRSVAQADTSSGGSSSGGGSSSSGGSSSDEKDDDDEKDKKRRGGGGGGSSRSSSDTAAETKDNGTSTSTDNDTNTNTSTESDSSDTTDTTTPASDVVASNNPPAVSAGGALSLSVSASPIQITQGNSARISWSSDGASSCSASNGWSGSKRTSGSETVSPDRTTRYTLTCTGANGTETKSAIVLVSSVGTSAQPAQNTPTIPTPPELSGIITGNWTTTLQNYIEAESGCNDFEDSNWCRFQMLNALPDLRANEYPNERSYGNAGPRAAADAFSNWAFDEDRGGFYIFGGGHAASGDARVFFANLNTLTFEALNAVPPLEIPTGTVDTDGDGVFDTCPVPNPLNGPAAFHTYGGKIYHDDWLYVMGMSQFCPTGGGRYEYLMVGDPARQAEYEAQGWIYEPASQLLLDENGYPIQDRDYVHTVGWRFHIPTKTWEHYETPNSEQGAAAYIGNGEILMLPHTGHDGYIVDTKLLSNTPSGQPNPNPSRTYGGGGGTRYGTIRYAADADSPDGAGLVYSMQQSNDEVHGQIIVRTSPRWDSIRRFGWGGWNADFPWARTSGFELHPDRDAFVIWNGAREVYYAPRKAIEQTTNSFAQARGYGLERYPNAGGDAPNGIAVQGKWKYLPQFDVFVGMASGAEANLWLYRLPSTPGVDPEWEAAQAAGYTCIDSNANHACEQVNYASGGNIQLASGIYEQATTIDLPTTITGPAVLQKDDHQNKGYFVVRNGGALTLSNIIGRDAKFNLSAAALVWMNPGAGPLKILNSTLRNNYNGVLGQVDDSMLIEDSLLEYNGGYPGAGTSGRGHGFYTWGSGTVTVRNTTIRCAQNEGHLVKSGGPHLIIEDSILDERGDECLGSRVIDAYNGGILELRNVKIYTKENDGNTFDVIGYDYESRSDADWQDNKIILDNVEVVCQGKHRGRSVEAFIAGRNSLKDAEIIGWDTVSLTGCEYGVLERGSGSTPDNVIRSAQSNLTSLLARLSDALTAAVGWLNRSN